MDQNFVYDDTWNSDKPIQLDELKSILTKLQKKYGKKAILKTDAGYNNVSIMIKKEE